MNSNTTNTQFVADVKKTEKALENVLNTLTKGIASNEEEALWLMRKVIEKMGAMRNMESFLHLNMDGFMVSYGSNEGFEDAEAKIEAFNLGMISGMKASKGNG